MEFEGGYVPPLKGTCPVTNASTGDVVPMPRQEAPVQARSGASDEGAANLAEFVSDVTDFEDC